MKTTLYKTLQQSQLLLKHNLKFNILFNIQQLKTVSDSIYLDLKWMRIISRSLDNIRKW